MAQNWFEHGYNSRNSQAMIEFRFRWGAEGYGVYWMLLESIAQDEIDYLINDHVGGLALSIGVEPEKLIKIINDCVKLGLFTQDENENIHSNKMTIHKNKMKDYSKFGKKGAKHRWKNTPPIHPPIHPPIAPPYTPPMAIREDKIKEDNIIKELKKPFGEFKHVLLTKAQFDKCKQQWGPELFMAAIQELDDYIENKGTKYKNHAIVLKKWPVENARKYIKPKYVGGA